jgi:hypothetical protein
MQHSLFLMFFIFKSMILSQQPITHQNVLIGIIEDNRRELINWKKGPAKTRMILPLFKKIDNEWILNNSLQGPITWTIAFDGKNKGIISSHPNEALYIDEVSTYIPEQIKDQKLIMGQPSEIYSGWENTLFNRPLVLVSNGNFGDPAKWKPLKYSEGQSKLFKNIFINAYPKVINCDENEKPLPNPTPVNNSDIKITTCYCSNEGSYLVNMILNGGKCGVYEGPFLNQLFFIQSDKNSIHVNLGNNPPQPNSNENENYSFYLVDAGDYDGDLKSELVFFVSGYNEDGYVLFYDDFKKKVVYTWHYH